MKRYTKIIAGIDVQFIIIGSNLGWFFNLNGKEYGDYITLQIKPKRIDELQVEETFELLEQQAKESIKEILNKNEKR